MLACRQAPPAPCSPTPFPTGTETGRMACQWTCGFTAGGFTVSAALVLVLVVRRGEECVRGVWPDLLSDMRVVSRSWFGCTRSCAWVGFAVWQWRQFSIGAGAGVSRFYAVRHGRDGCRVFLHDATHSIIFSLGARVPATWRAWACPGCSSPSQKASMRSRRGCLVESDRVSVGSARV